MKITICFDTESAQDMDMVLEILKPFGFSRGPEACQQEEDIPAADALKGFLTAREHNAIRSQDYRSKKPIMISEIKDLSTAQLMRVKGVGPKGAMNIKAAISSYYESKK